MMSFFRACSSALPQHSSSMMQFSSASPRRVVHVVVLRDDAAVDVVPYLRQQVAALLVGVVRGSRAAVLEARFEVRAGEIVVCEPDARHHHALHTGGVRLVLYDALARVVYRVPQVAAECVAVVSKRLAV